MTWWQWWWLQVENILRPLELTDDDYRKVMQLMLDNMERGLASSTNASAVIKMFPTYVRAVPDGTGKHIDAAAALSPCLSPFVCLCVWFCSVHLFLPLSFTDCIFLLFFWVPCRILSSYSCVCLFLSDCAGRHNVAAALSHPIFHSFVVWFCLCLCIPLYKSVSVAAGPTGLSVCYC